MGEHRDTDLQRRFALDAWPGPARRIDDARFSAIVAGALGGAGFPPPPIDPGGAGAAHGGAKVATSSAAKGLAAGKLTVLIGGALSAALAMVAWVAVRTPPAPPASVESPALPTVAESLAVPTVVDSPAAPDPVDHAAPASAGISRAIRGEAPPVAPVPAVDSRDRRRVAITAGPAHPGGASKGGRRRLAKPTAAPAQEPAPVAAPRTPDDLLAEANAARAAHRWHDADALYARVANGEPGLAAQTALVASATIRLEHLGDPAGAAHRFRAALAAGPRDALAEDARWGLAEVARVTGDTAAERRALDDFLARHAVSPRAPRARARRIELGAAP